MDYFKDFKTIILCIILLICTSVYVFSKKRRYKLLPGPRGLPFLGILPFLGKNPHEYLDQLGKKYGGIFGIYLGRTYVVAVTDVTLVKQLLSKTSTADRPPGMFQLMPNGVGLADLNGTEWIEQRRFTIKEMKNLGLGRSPWEELVKVEVSDVVELLSQTKGEPTDVKDIFSASVSNNILSLVSNQRLPMGDPKREIVDHGVESFQQMYNPVGIIVHYPKLFKLAVSLGLLKVKRKLKNMLRMNTYIRELIEELKHEKSGESFIHEYFNEIQRNKDLDLENSFNDYNLMGNVQALVIAGSDTTYISLLWLLLAMASYPKVQQRLHEELDSVLGKSGAPDWIDREKLPYCMATIMEGQRWRTVVPLNLLHRTNEHVIVNGYDIPKGTNIITVLWAIHNDTRYWSNPDLFQPERFLTEHGKVKKNPEAYLPFSIGKRVCLGKTVALIELFQYFVPIMQKFQVLPASETCRPDLEGFPGLTFQPKQQPLRFVSRSSRRS